MPYISCVPPNPNFIEVTNRLLMAMPPHMGFDIADVAPGRFEITQPFRRELSFREGGSTRVPSAAWPTWRRPAQVRRCCLMAVAASTVDYTLKLLAPAVGDVLVARYRYKAKGIFAALSQQAKRARVRNGSECREVGR